MRWRIAEERRAISGRGSVCSRPQRRAPPFPLSAPCSSAGRGGKNSRKVLQSVAICGIRIAARGVSEERSTFTILATRFQAHRIAQPKGRGLSSVLTAKTRSQHSLFSSPPRWAAGGDPARKDKGCCSVFMQAIYIIVASSWKKSQFRRPNSFSAANQRLHLSHYERFSIP
jgi:hypothetical protein